jgi:flagellar motor switch protein FliN/FliY
MSRPSDSATAFLWLAAEWAECLSAVVEAATGKNPSFSGTGDAFAGAEGVALTQPLSLGPDCALTFSFGQTAANAIGEAALSSLGIEAADKDAARGTFLELIHQAATAVAGRISAEIGREVTCQPAREELLVGAQLRAVRGELSGTPLDHGFGVSSGLIAALVQRTGHAAAGGPAPEEETHRTLDLLLDVELPVSVSFGRARVALKDVLKLTSGSIVELNRSVSDPVEVIVNNCVIARGEVVVVDGNYGIRVQEILSRQERLRTLN